VGMNFYGDFFAVGGEQFGFIGDRLVLFQNSHVLLAIFILKSMHAEKGLG
jgi:hypothetical protein